jgi:hypothetical protein
MTVDNWLKAAMADADARGLPELKSLLESLAQATRLLRSADFGGRAAAANGDKSVDG